MALPNMTQACDFIFGLLNKLLNEGGFNQAPQMVCLRRRFSIAEINAGATLLPAIPNYSQFSLGWRMVDLVVIAIGGNASGLTALTISATQGGSVVVLDSIAVAALTQSAVNRPGAANNSVLADGASFAVNDANTAITVQKTGGNLATSTFVDVIAQFVLEAN